MENRLLIVDDNEAIHEDFEHILKGFQKGGDNKVTNQIEKELFGGESGEKAVNNNYPVYEMDHSFSGEDALERVEALRKQGKRYSVAIIDERMPPGINGIETISRLWKIDPNIEVVLCTAYSDYSWSEVVESLSISDRLLVLKKPFDFIEVKQIVAALTEKNNLRYQAEAYRLKIEKSLSNKSKLISDIFRFANNLNFKNSSDEILESTVDIIKDLTGARRISIMIKEEGTDFLVIKKETGLPKDLCDKVRVRVGEGIVGEVYKTSEIKIVNDINKTDIDRRLSEAKAFISAPFVCTPLRGNTENLGVINVTNKKDNQVFTDEDVDIISYISSISAATISSYYSRKKLESSYLDIIKALSSAIEAKDSYTRGHSDRVSNYAVAIGKRMGLPDSRLKKLEIAGIVHDIGKLGVNEDILRKPSRLTLEEYNVIKQHPTIGESILSNIKFLDKVRQIIRQHHERNDGSGYPDGLSREDISIEARILAVADTYDAMSSNRPYRSSIEIESIKNELAEISGEKLEPECVDSLLALLEEEAV